MATSRMMWCRPVPGGVGVRLVRRVLRWPWLLGWCARCASPYRQGWAPAMMRWISGFFWLLSAGGWAPVVIRWIAGFLRAFRWVCRRLFCGGLGTSFIRHAYLHTTSSVLVHRATVHVAPPFAAMHVPPMLCVGAACVSAANGRTIHQRKNHSSMPLN
jgi:hypothetical protein